MTTIAGGLGIYADDANTTNRRVSVTTFVNKHSHSVATVDRAEFLAAVANELDVIITPRTDLPEVEDDGSGDLRVIPGDRPESVLPSTPGADEYRRRALVSLALAEHLDQNPPVDEAQVGALWNLMAQHHDDARNQVDEVYGRALARCLVAAGVRAPEAGDDQ